jgi:hypothetical protein
MPAAREQRKVLAVDLKIGLKVFNLTVTHGAMLPYAVAARADALSHQPADTILITLNVVSGDIEVMFYTAARAEKVHVRQFNSVLARERVIIHVSPPFASAARTLSLTTRLQWTHGRWRFTNA